MKTPLVLLLVLSLAGNAVLAVMSLRSPRTPERPASPVPAASAATAAGVATPSTTVAAGAPSAPVTTATWKALKPDGNLHTAIANLRAAGFPPSVIRAVASQLVAEQLRNSDPTGHLPFWKQTPANAEYAAAMQARGLRQREMTEDLLGADARPSAGLDPASRERRYGQLSDEKIDHIENLNRDISDLRTKMYAERKPGDMQSMMSTQAAMEQEQRAELAALLTPAELEQYEMRSSQSANRVMNNLKGFEVTEAEYAALYRAQKAFDAMDPLRSTGTVNQDGMVLRAAAQEAMNEQARAALPDDRFYEYLKSADSNYARTAQFTANYPTITPAMTYELTQIERTYQAAMMSVARPAGGGPMPADRMAQMSAARKEYQDQVASLLGPEVATAYNQRNRGGVVTSISTGTTSTPAMRLPGGP